MTKIKDYTDLGFKRAYNKMYPLMDGYCRAFVKCTVCGKRAGYNYVPFSTSAPVITTRCGHSFEDHYKHF